MIVKRRVVTKIGKREKRGRERRRKRKPEKTFCRQSFSLTAITQIKVTPGHWKKKEEVEGGRKERRRGEGFR